MSATKAPPKPTLDDAMSKAQGDYARLIASLSRGSPRVQALLRALFESQLQPDDTDLASHLVKVQYATKFLCFLEANAIRGERLLFGYFGKCLELGEPLRAYYEPTSDKKEEEEPPVLDASMRKGEGESESIPAELLSFRPWQAALFVDIGSEHLRNHLMSEELGQLTPMLYMFATAYERTQKEKPHELGGHIHLSLSCSAARLMRDSCQRMRCDAFLEAYSLAARFNLLACLWMGHSRLRRVLQRKRYAGPPHEWTTGLKPLFSEGFCVAELMRLSMWIMTAGQEEVQQMAGPAVCNFDAPEVPVSTASSAKEQKRERRQTAREGGEIMDHLVAHVGELSGHFEASIDAIDAHRQLRTEEPLPMQTPYDIRVLQVEIRRVSEEIRKAMLRPFVPALFDETEPAKA
jgi:hypothetical protein